jgi:hypothetical protein
MKKPSATINMKLTQFPEVERFLFTINLTRVMTDGTTEPTMLNMTTQINPLSIKHVDTQIIRALLNAIDSVASTAILSETNVTDDL